MGHPAVKEAAVIAIPDAKWAERPLAVVVPRDAAACTPEALRAYLAERFAKWQIPEAFEFVESIPHTSTGKMLKAELRKRCSACPGAATWSPPSVASGSRSP